jgi:ABC-type multidrug transport system ATPase subunit
VHNKFRMTTVPEAAMRGGGGGGDVSMDPFKVDGDDPLSGINDHQENGETRQQQSQDLLMLSFEKLTVYVPGENKQCCGGSRNPAASCLQEYCGMQIQQHDPFYALDGISGYLPTGQMCLVLGGTQQSKSTLLRVLSGRSNEQDEVSGNVLLNGMPVAKSLQSWRRLCPYISASDTTHSAVLTVRETLEFAAQCTSDGTQSKQEIDDRVNKMLKALSLEHVGDTVVGDNNLRGVSGGQKRRVTVGEMAIDRKCRYLFCENITDGLSSTDSLQIIQKLKMACEHYHHGAMVTLMQPSDEMIELFDTVLVLTTHGEMAYFGPVDRATLSKVFASEDNPNSNNNSSSIADLIEEYRVKPNVDALEEIFVKRYNASDSGKDVVAKLAEIRSESPAAKDRNLDKLLPSTKYSTHGWYQFRILMARRVKLIMRNSVTWTRIVIAIVFGVIIGSLFSSLDQNILGALGRTGYMFLNCFLVLMLSAAVTIPSMYRDRVTLFKHRSAEFYSGRIAYAAQVLTDTPLSLLEAFLLATISFFWVRLSYDGWYSSQ